MSVEKRIENFNQLLSFVKSKEKKKLAIASAEGEEIVEAVKRATDEDIIQVVLIGDAERIMDHCQKLALDMNKVEIINAKDPKLTSQLAVELVKRKKADMLMKGKVDTSTLLKAVLDKEKGLRGARLLSHVAVVEVENYHKLMLVTDGGMNINPDVNKKVDILKNAIEVARKLGIQKPKVSCLAAVELVNPEMQETVDAAVLVKMAERGDISHVVIDGPIAFDVAIDSQAARMKGIISPTAGDTDIFLVPNITAGNIFVKALIYLAKAKVGGIVVGGGAPIVLLSRSDTAAMKLYSMALGAAVC
ncbi:MAG: bifunctional enoyl-CoA hydratase/phosphate acetyltransferase [candidate division Zixibacteria bacterium]|nr:bifunctional enoyl-CoA hydratase/phosphate acetyltransferase [candidate division Zixibacteria bacterium]